MKKFILFILLLIILLLLPFSLEVRATEPWYYQDDNTFEFMIPDKVQHYWGSYFLSRQSTPVVSLIAGVSWEFYQDEFSIRDVIADSFGILSEQINKGAFLFDDNVRMWMDYNTLNKEVLINISYRW